MGLSLMFAPKRMTRTSKCPPHIFLQSCHRPSCRARSAFRHEHSIAQSHHSSRKPLLNHRHRRSFGYPSNNSLCESIGCSTARSVRVVRPLEILTHCGDVLRRLCANSPRLLGKKHKPLQTRCCCRRVLTGRRVALNPIRKKAHLVR